MQPTQWALPLETGASEFPWPAFHQHCVHRRVSIDFVEFAVLAWPATEKTVDDHFLCPPDA